MTVEQQDRNHRAAIQIPEYGFIKKPGRVLIRKGGRTIYVVTTTFCTCPDFEERCEGKGMRCKHMVMVEQTGLLR